MARLGAVETLRLVGDSEPIRGADVAEAETWRQRLSARLREQSIDRTVDESERLGLRVLIPGDPEWPAGFAVLRERHLARRACCGQRSSGQDGPASCAFRVPDLVTE